MVIEGNLFLLAIPIVLDERTHYNIKYTAIAFNRHNYLNFSVFASKALLL
jgi:hypothetical protein